MEHCSTVLPTNGGTAIMLSAKVEDPKWDRLICTQGH